MIITNDFVMLNLPKTGSTFTRKVITEAYQRKASNLNVFHKAAIKLGLKENKYVVHDYWVKTINAYQLKSQHGAYIQIPDKDKAKKVYSILRNPYEAMVSRYEFRHWSREPLISKEVLYTELPNFPNLSFDEFISFQKLNNIEVLYKKYNIPKDVKIGGLSIQMILMFFKEPFKALEHLTPDYIDSEDAYKADIADIKFLNNNNLNNELYQLLLANDFSENEVEFVKNFEKIHVTKRDEGSRINIWNTSALNYMHDYEKLVLRIYKEIDPLFKLTSV